MFNKLNSFVRSHSEEIATVVNVIIWTAIASYAVAVTVSAVASVVEVIKEGTSATEEIGNTEIPTIE